MNAIQNKINALGGVKKITQSVSDDSLDNYIEEVKYIIGDIPDTETLEFIKEFGFSIFNNHIMSKFIDKSQFLSTGEIEIGLIFGFGKGTDSVSSTIEKYNSPDQINCKFFPLFEGYPGDIIFYSLEASTNGQIYYWHHEADINAEKILIAKSFKEFISELYVKDEEIEVLPELSDTELESINNRRKKVGLPLIDKFRNEI